VAGLGRLAHRVVSGLPLHPLRPDAGDRAAAAQPSAAGTGG
jgi:hypothetical protein